MTVVKTKRGKRQDKPSQAKPFLFGNKVWCSQYNVLVVAGQPAGWWAILEGCPQRAKSGWGVKMVNPTMADSIKGNSCEQWKRGEEQSQQEIEIEQGRKWGKRKRT